MEMPRLISSECRSVHSPESAWVSVVFPWSTWPMVPMLTSGCLGTFMLDLRAERPEGAPVALLLGRLGGHELGDGLGAEGRDLGVDLRDLGADLSAAEVQLGALARVVPGAVADGLGDEELLAGGAADLGAHGDAVLVRAAGDLHLVAGQAQEHAVDLVADLLADEDVRVLARDRQLVALAVARVGDDHLEINHEIPDSRGQLPVARWRILGGRGRPTIKGPLFEADALLAPGVGWRLGLLDGPSLFCFSVTSGRDDATAPRRDGRGDTGFPGRRVVASWRRGVQK